MTRLYLPNAIDVRLHEHKDGVVILTPEMVDLSLSVGFFVQNVAMDIARWFITAQMLLTCSLNWG